MAISHVKAGAVGGVVVGRVVGEDVGIGVTNNDPPSDVNLIDGRYMVKTRCWGCVGVDG